MELHGHPKTLPPLTQNEINAPQIAEMDWAAELGKCPEWGLKLKQLNDPKGKWLDHYKIVGQHLYFREKMCIPLQAQRGFIRASHDAVAHVGFLRLWKHIGSRYEWANPVDARKFAKVVSFQCDVCQSCRPIGRTKIGLEPILVPDELMSSVSMDLFALPTVVENNRTFDTLALCVDRLSGWIVAVPGSKHDMTGEFLAKQFFEQWRFFGIPTVITSDQGPQFVSSWWRTLCSLLGVRLFASQAYHHQANGRAEVAGRHVITRLNLCNQDVGETWVTLLPHVLDCIHDTVGVGGYSPYQIMFGRERPMHGLPYEIPKSWQDARFFCANTAKNLDSCSKKIE